MNIFISCGLAALVISGIFFAQKAISERLELLRTAFTFTLGNTSYTNYIIDSASTVSYSQPNSTLFYTCAIIAIICTLVSYYLVAVGVKLPHTYYAPASLVVMIIESAVTIVILQTVVTVPTEEAMSHAKNPIILLCKPRRQSPCYIVVELIYLNIIAVILIMIIVTSFVTTLVVIGDINHGLPQLRKLYKIPITSILTLNLQSCSVEKQIVDHRDDETVDGKPLPRVTAVLD
jgi:hypothetical protein